MPETGLPPVVYVAIVAVAILLLAGFWLAMPQRARTPDRSLGLTGTWGFSSAPDAPPNGLITFHADGTLVQTATTWPGTSLGHGDWRRAGEGVFEATIWVLQFGEAGELAGRTQLAHVIQVQTGGEEATISQQARSWDAEGRGTAAMPAVVQHARRLRMASSNEIEP